MPKAQYRLSSDPGSLPSAAFSTSTARTLFLLALEPAAFASLAGLVVLAVVLWLPVVLRDPDTLWHITTGQWILASGEVPAVDSFSFTAAGRPWVAHEWLSEVILAAAYDRFGWSGPVAITGVAAGCTIACVAFYVRQRSRADVAAMLVILAATCGGPSLLARPHLIALPLAALWTVALVSARSRNVAPPLILVPLMTLWANLHGGFVVGLALTGALAVEAVFETPRAKMDTARRWSLFIAGAVAAAALTPHGIDGLLFPFRLLAMQRLDDIQEWNASDFSHPGGMTISVLLALYLGLTGSVRLPKFRALLLAGLLFATMRHQRHAQLFGILAPLLIADSLAFASRTSMHESMSACLPVTLASAAAAVFLTARVAYPVQRADDVNYPTAALAHVSSDVRSKPVLNAYGFGGLLIFSRIKPFIDGRADLYGDSFIAEYLSAVSGKEQKLDRLLCQYRIEWTMFEPDAAVPVLLDRMPGWHRLYRDQFAVIHARDQQAPFPNCLPPPG